MSKCVTSLPLQVRSTSVLQTFGVREKLCSEAREEENDHLSIFQWDITVSACIFSCFCIDLGPSLCLSLFLGGTKE